MKKLKLKIDQIIFGWYYRRVPEFFRKWPFRKSIKLLIQNYEHHELLWKNDMESLRTSIKEADGLRKELSDMKIKAIASDGQIDWANRTLGANIHKDSEN